MDFPKSVPGVGLVDGKFVDENQATGQVGSLIPSAWGNAVTEELLAVIVAAGLVPSEMNSSQLLEAIRLIGPAGQVSYFARQTPPAGWLKANGSTVSRTTYAALFAAIGTIFGAGDGVATFRLPDLRAEFMRGWDDGRSVDAGRVFGSAQVDSYANHSHALNKWAANGFDTTGGPFLVGADTAGYQDSSSLTGTSGGTETRPRNIALLACIKY